MSVLYQNVFECRILNIDQKRLTLSPNDCKFDADSKTGLQMPRKTIFRTGVKKRELEVGVKMAMSQKQVATNFFEGFKSK